MQSKAFNKHPRLSSYSHQLVKTNALVSKLQKTTRSGKRHTSAPPLRLKQSESTSKQQGKFEKVLNLTVPEKPNGLKCFFSSPTILRTQSFFSCSITSSIKEPKQELLCEDFHRMVAQCLSQLLSLLIESTESSLTL